MGSGDVGLDTDLYSWLLFAVILVLWGGAFSFLGERQLGRNPVLTSLFGFMWLGVGTSVVARFVVLWWDSVTFGNGSYRLAILPASTVNTALFLAVAFWGAVLGGYAVGVKRSGRGPLAVVDGLTAETAVRVAPLIIPATSLAMLMTTSLVPTPTFLVTPLSIVGALWVIPATVTWYESFRRDDRSVVTALRWWYLLPGVVRVLTSPYREHLLTLLMVPIIAGLCVRRRYRSSLVMVAIVGWFFASGFVVTAARRVYWEGETAQSAVEEVDLTDWRPDSFDFPVAAVLRRFHALDSLLLTVDLVPRVIQHSDRNVFLETLVSGFVPRAVYREKELSDRGLRFSRRIWGQHDPEAQAAAIAPSMPGDLYDAGGVIYVVLGAFAWGLAIGIVEGWRRRLQGAPAAGLLALFAIPAFASVERDFVHVVATLIQTLLIIAVVVRLLPVRRVEALTPAAEVSR